MLPASWKPALEEPLLSPADMGFERCAWPVLVDVHCRTQSMFQGCWHDMFFVMYLTIRPPLSLSLSLSFSYPQAASGPSGGAAASAASPLPDYSDLNGALEEEDALPGGGRLQTGSHAGGLAQRKSDTAEVGAGRCGFGLGG